MHVQAIITKYLGPTNFKGSRIRATAAAGSILVSYNPALSPDQNHDAAAAALARKFDWSGRYYRGGMPNDKGNVYVCDMAGLCDVVDIVNSEAVEDMALSLPTYGELYEAHMRMARAGSDVETWAQHVRQVGYPAWHKITRVRAGRAEFVEVAKRLQSYYAAHLAEG